MTSIITTTEVQQRIGTISTAIADKSYIVTNHGKGRIVMLPYFDGCDDTISDYLEDFAMNKNAEKLQRRYQQSAKSGLSSLVI
ncbi:MAG: hypothetical protein WCV88_03065 [Patescibacteria group bacterium]|jgi:hypothetical protein